MRNGSERGNQASRNRPAHFAERFVTIRRWAVNSAGLCRARYGQRTVLSGAAAGFASLRSFDVALTIRPPGPLPRKDFKSMPASAAMRAAIGEISTRPDGAADPEVSLPSALTAGCRRFSPPA